MLNWRANKWLWLLLLVLATRLLTMALLPVTDTTEARYAEISRLMESSGQWLVPQFEPGVPFWGKPPLFAWLTGAAIKLFGSSELAFRIPHFLLALAVLWLTARIGRQKLHKDHTQLAMLVLASCPLFFVAAGTVMTESGLLFSTTLAMTGFWLAVDQGSRAWGWLFFAGLGLGMLAKGPVGPALSLLPILMWAIAERDRRLLSSLPWLGGSLLCLLIFLPWYLAAERQSPGFLNYFLLGEHLLRFIRPGWEGDLYGNPHREWPGMIWLFWFQATAAWGLLFAWLLIKGASIRPAPPSSGRSWRRYLLSWLLAPLLFFTFSGNILWTYVITGLPAFALLTSAALRGLAGENGRPYLISRLIPGLAMIIPVAALAFTFLAPRGHFLLMSEKALVRQFQDAAQHDEALLYLDYRPDSARFYTMDTAGLVAGGAKSLPAQPFWLAIHRRDGKLPAWNCTLRHSPKSGVFDLYWCAP